MEKETAQSQWSTKEGQKRRNAIISDLQKGHTSDHYLLKHTTITNEGLIDLRGLFFGTSLELEDTSLQNVDMSYCDIGRGIFKRCIFERVLFKELDSQGLNERGCRFTDVDFYKANLRCSAIGINNSRYINVNFQEVDFTGTYFYGTQFIDCNFSDSKINNIDFNASSFINSKFKGRLDSVWFRRYYRSKIHKNRFGKTVPNEMYKVDFSEVELWNAMFTGGLDLSQVILPTDDSHILFHHFNSSLLKTSKMIDTLRWSSHEKESAQIFINAYLVHARKQPMWIINKEEILKILGDKVGTNLIELLIRNDTDK